MLLDNKPPAEYIWILLTVFTAGLSRSAEFLANVYQLKFLLNNSNLMHCMRNIGCSFMNRVQKFGF